MRILLGVDYNEFLLFYMLASQAYKIKGFQDNSVGAIFPKSILSIHRFLKTLNDSQNRNLSFPKPFERITEDGVASLPREEIPTYFIPKRVERMRIKGFGVGDPGVLMGSEATPFFQRP
jgi:hypothetical protein